jgi:hypothetical protein
MSRKRQLKKERARLEELDRQLERLARQGADEAVLELARGRAGELGPASLEIWSQAADRALRRALAGADLARVKRLLAWIGQSPGTIPGLLGLAEAVVHLDEGRPGEARTALASAADGPPGLVAAVAAVAALLDPCPPDGIEDAGVPAVRSLREALSSLPQGGEPERLRPVLAELRAALPAGAAAARRLLDAMDEALHLLDGLSAAEREPGRTRALFRPLLAVFRAGPPAPLLRPLHHALRLRWRSLLERVAEREGPAAWIDLHEVAPALFALDLEISGGPESLRRWFEVHGLRRNGLYRQLAGLLASLGGTETAPGRRVLLWSLELWAWEQAERAEVERGKDAFEILVRPESPDLEALRRLGRMAEEAAIVLPSEQRPGAARFLRARLIGLSEQLLSTHAAEAAEALLRHLPDDPGLLFIALAGARASGDLRRQKRIEARIEARTPARGAAPRGDRGTLLRLVSHLTLGSTELIAGLLPLLRPLFDEEAWPQALDIVLLDFTEYVRDSLEWSFGDPGEAGSLLRELEIYRASLSGRPGFAALERLLKKVARGVEGSRRKPRRRKPAGQGELTFDA